MKLQDERNFHIHETDILRNHTKQSSRFNSPKINKNISIFPHFSKKKKNA